jgi:hypothetical protein
MQDEHFEAPLKCIRDPTGEIKCGIKDPRHDLAVKLVDEGFVAVAAEKAEHHAWLQGGQTKLLGALLAFP